MAKKRNIIKLKFKDEYFTEGNQAYYHKRDNPFIMGYLNDRGDYYVQANPAKRSYTYYVYAKHVTPVQKPLILISVESEDTRKAEPQAQNKQ